MTTSAPQKLTYSEFNLQYGNADGAYEFWYGEVVPKGMPTWVHGLLQHIIMDLLNEAGFISASEVELRIEPDAHPKPDIVATTKPPTGPYPTEGLDVVVEIISEDNSYQRVKKNCRKYQDWGFRHIYLVDPSDRSLVEWRDGAQIPKPEFVGISAERIWQELDRQYLGSAT